ncbi:peroxiredoxin [Kocuria sp. CPCC 205261]|uniref:peroxiredoxin n=1 Tax=Kocuria sp. CPCC 205261 TaxID=3073554 RepID=UPI0034D58D27
MSRELSTGDPAPALRLTAHDGSTVDLADATHSGTVVYFYPKAFTPGCTTEACDFRDNLAALKGQGYDVYGVSGDDPRSSSASSPSTTCPTRFSPTPPEPGRVPHTPRGQWPPGRTVTAAATSGWLPSCRLPSGRREGTPLDHRGLLFVPS